MQEFIGLATPPENAYIEAFCLPLENDVIHIHWLDFIHLAAMKNRDNIRAD